MHTDIKITAGDKFLYLNPDVMHGMVGTAIDCSSKIISLRIEWPHGGQSTIFDDTGFYINTNGHLFNNDRITYLGNISEKELLVLMLKHSDYSIQVERYESYTDN
jgi:hypothetical protein